MENTDNESIEKLPPKNKLEQLKTKFNSLTLKQKTNFIFIPGLVLIFGGAFFFLVTSGDKKDNNAIDDFTTPESELIKYNNKLEAVNTDKDQPDFSIKTTEPEETVPTENADYSKELAELDRQLSNQPGTTGGSNYSQSSGTPKNSHDVYGNYDMWQMSEPKNNSIGYSDVKNYPTKPKAKAQTYEPAYTDVTPSPQPVQNVEVKASKKIRAKLLSTGFASNGRDLSFIMLEPTTIGGEQTKKGQVITGSARISEDRLTVRFRTIKINGKTIPINGSVMGFDGDEGMPISGERDGSGTGDYIRDEAVSQSSRIPVVGGIISRASNSRGTSQDKIKLNQNTDVIIQIY
ncbi:uncharacterized protein DUF3714 [Chryseobacterium sp. CBTAP 102]|uniref:conjugative transposon protein TraM n=1 Tax=Chryseobacterium sp. CBTAP 102 TaxID=2135644 RepID=UPI000D766E3A|nr:conjugative transposon protein TraM [Chryseobacterium sp. CBTAP 102]PXW07092.1 uncharacterized protein DUF3714 [Chryseobacterium sp. CBTAP 102]